MMTSTNVHHTLDDILDSVSVGLNCRAKVRKEYGRLPNIACDSADLMRLLMEILLEAMRVIEDCGEISIRTWSDKASVYASFRSNGTSLSTLQFPQVVATLLATEEQRDFDSSRAMTVCELVTKQDGRLSVESCTGKGVTFTIQLPIASQFKRAPTDGHLIHS